MELQSANLSELMPELIQAISQLGNLSKDKQGYGYKYAELSKVLDTCRPILAEHNLVITQLVTVLKTAHFYEIALSLVLARHLGQ